VAPKPPRATELPPPATAAGDDPPENATEVPDRVELELELELPQNQCDEPP
jgi:hypothetical protein